MNVDRLEIHEFFLTEGLCISCTMRSVVANVASFRNGELKTELIESFLLDVDGLTRPKLETVISLDSIVSCYLNVR